MEIETRMEKTKRLRKESRKRFCKLLIIGFILIILFAGIKVVNHNIVYLDYLENPNILNVDLKQRKIDVFGKSYFIDFQIFKKHS